MTNVKGMTKQSVIRYIVTSLQRTYGSTTQRFNDLTWRSRSSLSARGAFTLIELIVVVTVIVILTGLVLSTVGYVQKKAARSRAETEIAAMSAALESYKADNGAYPAGSATNTLDARTYLDPSDPAYSAASLFLYERLMGVTTGNRSETPSGKTYFTFKPNMLLPAPPSTADVTAIRDPFGNSYGYSTIQTATGDSTKGYNPTFDLWSTAGAAPSPTPAPPAVQQDLWTKNW
jgi:prepilin-type N-terminal cleavage/methylation domain-containing protein